MAMFSHDLKLALQLVTWHASSNLYLLCRVPDAKEVVQQTVTAISSFISKWNLPVAVDIPEVAPAAHVPHDNGTLDRCLGYVFEDQACEFLEIGSP